MRLFGLIGYPLSHSFSKKFFTNKFEKEGITDCRYELFPLTTMDALQPLLQKNPELEGLNVTIPYKQQVLPFLDESHLPQGLDACNCINIIGGKLAGYNTDVTGFELSLSPHLRTWHQKALVLGSGGAAAAVVYVLQKLGIDYTIVSRKKQGDATMAYSAVTKATLAGHQLIINTTPLGMEPETNTCPAIPYRYITEKHLLYDLVYNPAKTLFLQKGEERGATTRNGEEMLLLQAEESWRIWNS